MYQSVVGQDIQIQSMCFNPVDSEEGSTEFAEKKPDGLQLTALPNSSEVCLKALLNASQLSGTFKGH